MMPGIRGARLARAFGVCAIWTATALAIATNAQTSLVELLQRHGVQVKAGAIEAAFDASAAPTVPVTPGSFATPLALLTTATGPERIDSAYAFGILAGRSGRAASPQELNAAGQALIQMLHSEDRRTRIAGARVAGRIFATPFDKSGARAIVPNGMVDAVFTLLNQDTEIEQLAAMDALGLLRESSAVTSLNERYLFHRERRERSLAGGALEALARIGDPSSIELAKQLTGDRWADGRDATALAVAFARERLLRDGSIVQIQLALEDKSRRNQARGYLAELGAPVP
jgi:HEAT repeat protein